MHAPPVERQRVPLHDWQALLGAVCDAAGTDPYWQARLSEPRSFAGGVHLAVCAEPYLRAMIEGRKTVESRFSARRTTPYERVFPGDVILLKRSAGPITGVCEVAETWFYPLDPAQLADIRATFAQALCMDGSTFWRSRERASFASLLRLSHVRAIAPLACDKRDRRGWVVLKPGEAEDPLSDLSSVRGKRSSGLLPRPVTLPLLS